MLSPADLKFQFRRFIRGLVATGKKNGASGIRIKDGSHYPALYRSLEALEKNFKAAAAGRGDYQFPRTFAEKPSEMRDPMDAELLHLADPREQDTPWLTATKGDTSQVLHLNISRTVAIQTLEGYSHEEQQVLGDAARAFSAFTKSTWPQAPATPANHIKGATPRKKSKSAAPAAAPIAWPPRVASME